jgi:sporulation protein YlmC with PRC-barrel domain
MSEEAELRLSLAARVVNREGEAIGQLNEIVVELASRRIAGFHIVSDEAAPRELFVMVGQVTEFASDQLTLDLSDEEFVALPDARQHLFIAPDQDIEEEIADAESGHASAAAPDPDERPVPTGLPGIALTANMLIPMEIERSIMDEDQVALRDGMRIIAADGEEIGQLGGVVVDKEARLLSIILNDERGDTIDYNLIEAVDDDTNELILLAEELIDTETEAAAPIAAPTVEG